MRTTLAIDDDVFIAARAIAQQSRRSIGAVLSELARGALARPQPAEIRNGVPLLALSRPGTIVTLQIVNQLRDELP